MYEKFSGEDFEGYFIVIADGSSRAPTRAYCEQTQTQFGLTMPVLIDRSGRLRSAGISDRHWHYVLDEGADIVFRQQFNDQNFQTKLTELLGR